MSIFLKENLKSPSINQLTGIQAIAEQYDAFLIDLWGVVHDGINPYPEVIDCIHQITNLGKKIIFLSNAPRPGTLSQQKLIEFGVKPDTFSVLTSGDTVREQLQKFDDPIFSKLGKRFFHLGQARNTDILSGISSESVDTLENADFILLTAYADEGETITQHNDFFKKALHLKLPLICANPDKIVVDGNKKRFCSGKFAEIYEHLGGTVYYYGKPHLAIYEMAFRLLAQQGVYDKQRILMIGDTLDTDILGAKRAEIDSLLVQTGNMGNLLKEYVYSTRTFPELLKNIFIRSNIASTWVIPSLKW